MLELQVKDIKNGEIVYGCAFNIDFDRQNWYGGRVTHNICKPVKGVVKKWNEPDDYPHGEFYILKADGTPRKSGKVSTYSRHFTRTYGECVEIYNQLIKEKQEKLRSIADELEKEIL